MRVLFAGPSIYGAEIDTTDFDLRGPARQGDIAMAVSEGATAIGLIDGLFSQAASVWHKEILFALHRGVAVYGGASMGALRAAECAMFGMIPVGKIAEAYLSGALDDDGAVALTMLPEEMGWQAATEPLVDVWATLNNLRTLNLIRDDQHAALCAAASTEHFTVRLPEVFIRSGLPTGEADAVCDAYFRHHVSQKRDDAIALIDEMRGNIREQPVDWEFRESPMWNAYRKSTHV